METDESDLFSDDLIEILSPQKYIFHDKNSVFFHCIPFCCANLLSNFIAHTTTQSHKSQEEMALDIKEHKNIFELMNIYT